MFTVSGGDSVLTAVQSLRPVFQSVRAEKQSSAFTHSLDSGQLSGSAALAVVYQELLLTAYLDAKQRLPVTVIKSLILPSC